MLTAYLELESLRFGRPFTYCFELGPNLNPYTIAIPGMIVQPFVENAIWHGLMHKPGGGGHIRVAFLGLSDAQLRCTVEDNGVDRRETAGRRSPDRIQHRSAGLRITAERLSLLTSGTQSNSPVRITDQQVCLPPGKAGNGQQTTSFRHHYAR